MLYDPKAQTHYHLVDGDPRWEWVIDVPGLVPLCLGLLLGHAEVGRPRHRDRVEPAGDERHDVAHQHGKLLKGKGNIVFKKINNTSMIFFICFCAHNGRSRSFIIQDIRVVHRMRRMFSLKSWSIKMDLIWFLWFLLRLNYRNGVRWCMENEMWYRREGMIMIFRRVIYPWF